METLVRDSSAAQQRVKELKTANGVKDTFLQAFIDKLASSVKGKRGARREAALDAAIADLPEGELRSAIWRLGGEFLT